MRVLVVEDDEGQIEVLVRLLADEHYAVDVARDGETASEMMSLTPYDLVVLDWTIPGPSGIDLLRSWREEGRETPVLMLTGRTAVEERVGGLDTGADDYLTKPFLFEELLARIRSLLRRREKPLVPRLEAGELEMDRARRAVTVAGRTVELTPKEFGLLEYLLLRKGEVVTRTDLSEHVWDHTFDSMSNVIDVTVHRLRKKLAGDGEESPIRTVPGVGYVLDSAAEGEEG